MAFPQRIVSLVPSLTELVWWLGAEDRLVGRTQFCVVPAEMAGMVTDCGGTKNPDIASIAAMQPDLVIANREENRREDVEALREHGLRVVVTDPSTVREAMDTVLQIGTLLGLEERARELYTATAAALSEGSEGPQARVFVPAWRKPLMAVGGDTYGSDVLRQAGLENVFGDRDRYPEVTQEEVEAAKPDLILLPDEPYHFTEEHAREFSAIAPARVVDGQLLWWYGPRMAESIRTLRAMVTEALER